MTRARMCVYGAYQRRERQYFNAERCVTINYFEMEKIFLSFDFSRCVALTIFTKSNFSFDFLCPHIKSGSRRGRLKISQRLKISNDFLNDFSLVFPSFSSLCYRNKLSTGTCRFNMTMLSKIDTIHDEGEDECYQKCRGDTKMLIFDIFIGEKRQNCLDFCKSKFIFYRAKKMFSIFSHWDWLFLISPNLLLSSRAHLAISFNS